MIANRLATEPSVIQEIPLSMEKSGLRSHDSVVASIITTPHLRFCEFVQCPEATARRNETTRVIVQKYDHAKSRYQNCERTIWLRTNDNL